MPLTILMYGDFTSYNGRIRENVGLERCWIKGVSLHICTIICMYMDLLPAYCFQYYERIQYMSVYILSHCIHINNIIIYVYIMHAVYYRLTILHTYIWNIQ